MSLQRSQRGKLYCSLPKKMPIYGVVCSFCHLDLHVLFLGVIFHFLDVLEVLFTIEAVFNHPCKELSFFGKEVLFELVPSPSNLDIQGFSDLFFFWQTFRNIFLSFLCRFLFQFFFSHWKNKEILIILNLKMKRSLQQAVAFQFGNSLSDIWFDDEIASSNIFPIFILIEDGIKNTIIQLIIVGLENFLFT